MINQNSNISSVWLVVNPQVISVFDFYDHLKILKLYRLSNVEIKDFSDTACFQVILKSDVLRETKIKNFEEKKQNEENEPMISILNGKDLSSGTNGKVNVIKDKIIGVTGEIKKENSKGNENRELTQKEYLLLKFMEKRKVLNKSNSREVFCAINTREKEIWLNSIRNHKLLEEEDKRKL